MSGLREPSDVRYVVCSLGGEADPWELPASTLGDRLWIHGGERSLYELAAAIAVTGREVELRGELSGRELDPICAAAGARPRIGLEPRRPSEDDLVIVHDGWTDPIAYARVALSPARAVILLLAPPGLFGWSFVDGWTKRDPLTVPLEDLARPEHFHGMRALGFDIWTNSEGIAEAGRVAGVQCSFIGTGQPIPFPAPPPKTHDVAFLEDNRWAPLAREVASRLNASVLAIPPVDRQEVLRRIGSASILLFPSRVEGTARIQIEARAMGTVPVGLSTNPFAAGLEERAGAVIVDSLEQMPGAVHRLLRDAEGLSERAATAFRSARAQVGWDSYLARLSQMLSWPPERQRGWRARSELGRAVEQLGERVGGLPSPSELRMRQERDAAMGELRRLRARRAVRTALRVAELAGPLYRLGRGTREPTS